MTGKEKGQVVLEKHVIIGSGSVIMPNLLISEGVSIGALSFVKESLLPWRMYGGIPAKFLKNRSKKILELEKDMID